MNGSATTKVIALDDDPTGSQTVHGCYLLTRWDIKTLVQALSDASPIFFVLTNTRGMDSASAARVTRDVCLNLRSALSQMEDAGHPVNPVMVSRSDSTLRGHYPVETDVISREMGPFDAHFIVPAFIEGGRITTESIHYVVSGGVQTPAHQTEFARDSVFGYHHSYLPDYVEEKTAGRIKAGDVSRFVLEDLRGDLAGRLMALSGNACCVVDAVTQDDLDLFAGAALSAVTNGKRFLFRSAAGILASLARLPPQPVAAEEMGSLVPGGRPGAVIVGSHVRRSTEQLEELLKSDGTDAVLIDVSRVKQQRDEILAETCARIVELHSRGTVPVVYTSREEVSFPDVQSRLEFGDRVSRLLVDIVRGLPDSTGYLISKGGITSNDILSHGLELRASRVLGQILPGCSVVACPADHPRHPGMPVVIFPGNVGDKMSLVTVLDRLTTGGSSLKRGSA